MFASKLKDDIFLIIIGPDIHKPKMNISKNLLNIFRPIWNQKIGKQYNFSIIVIDDQGLTSCTVTAVLGARL